MKSNRKVLKHLVSLTALLLICMAVAEAEDPCANLKHRALVLSGGGSKGAFETGAIYHLIVQRHCDFHEFSGVSVGALNAAFLARRQSRMIPVNLSIISPPRLKGSFRFGNP